MEKKERQEDLVYKTDKYINITSRNMKQYDLLQKHYFW